MTPNLDPALRAARSSPQHAVVAVTAAVVLYSTGPVMVQASAATGPVFSFWRLWFGVPVFALAVLTGRWRASRGRGTIRTRGWRSWRWAVWGGVVFGLHQVLFFTAVKATSVVDVTLIGTLHPAMTAIGAFFLFRERPGMTFSLFTLVAISGSAVIVTGGSVGPEGAPLGMAMATLNVVFFAGFFLVAKRGAEQIDVAAFLLGTMLVAALVLSVLVVLLGDPITAVTRTDLLYAVAVAAGPGFVGHLLATWAVRWIPATVPPVIKLAQPFLAGGLAWIVLGEGIGIAHLLGGALTVTGVLGAVLSPSGRAFVAGRPRPGRRKASRPATGSPHAAP